MLIEAALAALFGLLIGSFLNVCIYRLPRDLSVIRPRSYCPKCETPIVWYDNIPVVSYLRLAGKCRKCGNRISARYPIVELLTGAYFFIATYALGVTGPGIKACLLGAIVIALIFSDLEERILPDEFTVGGALAGFIIAAFVRMDFGFAQMFMLQVRNWRIVSVVESVFSAVFCAIALYLVGAAYQRIRHKEGLGFGDVKMVAMIGAFLGLQGALLTMIVGSVLGSVVGLAYIWITGKDMSSYELPFGSFLGLAALLVASYLEIFLKYAHAGA
jgi:leader peptidase (prepilin peptidase)/N-methyltransferase